MKTTIQEKLREIEHTEGVKILYSCESGSRAWGFPSPDSDFDVRFIYYRPMEEYLTIKPQKDHLSYPVDELWDVDGWDISKVLALIVKSNTTPFEWLQSPIQYRENPEFRDELWQICQHYFCKRSNIHHYLGIARGAMETMADGKIGIKKLFYILRPVLSALWCADRDSIAPMNIVPLMDLLPSKLQTEVSSLIEYKASKDEGFKIRIDKSLYTWINETVEHCTEVASQTEKQVFDMTEADEFFRKIILA